MAKVGMSQLESLRAENCTSAKAPGRVCLVPGLGSTCGVCSGTVGAYQLVPWAWEQENSLCLLPMAALIGLARRVMEFGEDKREFAA